jgi:transcriptional regulator with XRE-family HTH domain
MSSTPFGEHLRRERELRGVSLEEIAAATRIRTRFLEALENEQWDRLPGGAFNRGFIRSIARFLGIDEDSLVAEYTYERKSVDELGAVGRPEMIPRAWGSVVVIALTTVLVVAGGFWGVEHFRSSILPRLHVRFTASGATTAPRTSAILTAPSTVVPPTGGAPVVTDLALTIQASKSAELTVAADGQTVFAGSLQASDVKQFEAHQTLEIASSDSTAFVLTLNGHPMPWAGAAGEPRAMRLTRNNLATSAEASH